MLMVEGISGLLAVHARAERPQWTSSRRRLQRRSSAVAELFSAKNYEGLRGPQFSAAWLDELAKWHHGDESAPINEWRAPRASLDAFASFAGFDG
jgi:phage terminase large subunit-like protein